MKHWKSILLLALVFVAGTGVGAFGMRLATRRAVQQAIAHPEHAQALVEYRLGRKLNLDESQRQKVREILTVARGKLKDLRHDFQPQMAAVARTADENILALLTPEQQVRYQKFKQVERPLFPGVRPAP